MPFYEKPKEIELPGGEIGYCCGVCGEKYATKFLAEDCARRDSRRKLLCDPSGFYSPSKNGPAAPKDVAAMTADYERRDAYIKLSKNGGNYSDIIKKDLIKTEEINPNTSAPETTSPQKDTKPHEGFENPVADLGISSDIAPANLADDPKVIVGEGSFDYNMQMAQMATYRNSSGLWPWAQGHTIVQMSIPKADGSHEHYEVSGFPAGSVPGLNNYSMLNKLDDFKSGGRDAPHNIATSPVFYVSVDKARGILETWSQLYKKPAVDTTRGFNDCREFGYKILEDSLKQAGFTDEFISASYGPHVKNRARDYEEKLE